MKNLISRTIIGLALLIVTAWIFLKGTDLAFFIYFLAISTCALYELEKMVHQQEGAPDRFLLVLPFVLNVCYLLACKAASRWAMLSCWLVYVLVLLFYYLFNSKKSLGEVARPALLNLYISLFIGTAFFLPRTADLNGPILVLTIAWGCDTFAYLLGMFLGKRPLTKISPNKTIEGSLGGLGGALLLVLILRSFFFSALSVGKLALLALAGAVVSQCGDLLASRLKRTYGIKDYSHILGPHGGIMDRFDSFLCVLPFVYVLLAAFSAGGSL